MQGTFINHIQEAQIADAVARKKTNKKWHPFKGDGSYFRIVEGVLLQCPMNNDGTRDNSPCEVDWERIDEGEKQAAKAIFQVLNGQE